jgi:hypothetical protein
MRQSGEIPHAFAAKFREEEWCRAWESNPHEENPHGILSPERLPFRQPGTLADMQNIIISALGDKGDGALLLALSAWPRALS